MPMNRVVRRPFGFPGKLLLMTLLSIVGGFLWAMADSGRTFSDMAKIISSEPTPESTASAPPAAPPRGAPPTPGEPPVTGRPPAPPPAPPGPVAYTVETMTAPFDQVDGQLRQGRFKQV